MQIRALREADDRSRFRSGDPDLDRFLQRFAGQNQFRHYVGVTYVAVEEDGVLGFATVAPGHVEIEGLPAAERNKLPRYPLPVLRLARLAVDRSVQGQGLGGRLLRFVLQLAGRMADDYGCVGVVVDDAQASGEPGAVHQRVFDVLLEQVRAEAPGRGAAPWRIQFADFVDRERLDLREIGHVEHPQAAVRPAAAPLHFLLVVRVVL